MLKKSKNKNKMNQSSGAYQNKPQLQGKYKLILGVGVSLLCGLSAGAHFMNGDTRGTILWAAVFVFWMMLLKQWVQEYLKK